jgi:16S rRNA (adenine1518-N6/adenine1519-N6)-dimethyltransferase
MDIASRTMDIASRTKEIIKHFDFKFSKSLGQNFLISDEVLNNIMEGAGLNNDTCAIEIGPGIGTLTQEMAKRCNRVISIELDDSLIPVLSETLGNYDNIKIIHGDAMKISFNELIKNEELTNIKLVANLPYYVTTPIITKIFEEKTSIQSIIVMIQKEVGDRIVAKPGTKDYGALSLLCRYYSDSAKVCDVPPESFMPRPKVDSIVIRMNIKKSPAVEVVDENLFFKIIRHSFNMRRKTLWNSLKPMGLGDENLRSAFELSNIDPIRRGETLSIEEFGELSNNIKKILI